MARVGNLQPAGFLLEAIITSASTNSAPNTNATVQVISSVRTLRRRCHDR